MSNGDDPFSKFFRPGEPRLLDKVNFGGILSTTINAIVLTFFLMLVGIVQAAEVAFTTLVDSIGATIALIVSAPTMTLSEIQAEALGIAAREIPLFGIAALPVGVIIALSTVGVVVVFFNVFWRP